jgi:hypothetical protein
MTTTIELSTINLEETDTSSENNTLHNTKKEIKVIEKDQDSQQRLKVYSSFMIELFKVAMASFLSISVVQKCENGICSFSENIDRQSNYGNIVIGINVINIFAFLSLYYIEFNREMYMIKYLDINKEKGDYYLPNVLDKYEDIKKGLHKYNKNYFNVTKILLLTTVMNWSLSTILVLKYYYSVKTITSLLTNVLLIITKLNDAYSISKESYNNNYGLSAYIKEYTSFNVIDVDHV